MLVNADVKGLELYVAADWYDDTLLKEELLSGKDLHAENQQLFRLPRRTIAKIFVFKLLYGASAYGYYSDSDFMEVGFSVKQWQGVIDEFYSKYVGIAKGHERDLSFVKQNRYLEIPSGRHYLYEPVLWNGGFQWPLTKIKNYPIQGFGAELVMLARIEFRRLCLLEGIKSLFIGTIHDSLVCDARADDVAQVANLLNQAITSVPRLCEEVFGYTFSLPILCEVSFGMNKAEMMPYIRRGHLWDAVKEIDGKKVLLGSYASAKEALDIWMKV